MAKTEKFPLLCEVERLEDTELNRTEPKNSEEEDDELKEEEEEEEGGRRGRRPRKRAGDRGMAGLL